MLTLASVRASLLPFILFEGRVRYCSSRVVTEKVLDVELNDGFITGMNETFCEEWCLLGCYAVWLL
jgi:hypothetical protein